MKQAKTRPKQNKTLRKYRNSTWGNGGKRWDYQNLEAGRRGLVPKCLGRVEGRTDGLLDESLIVLASQSWYFFGSKMGLILRVNGEKTNWKLEQIVAAQLKSFYW